MGSWRVMLFVLLTIVFSAHETHSRRRGRSRGHAEADSMCSSIRDVEKRLEVVETMTNYTTEQRLADLETSLLNAIKHGLENLEAKIVNDTESRFATLETRVEDLMLRAMVFEVGSTNRTSKAKTVEDSERPERKTASNSEDLYQFPGAGSPLHNPDRLSKVEWELSCMQKFLSASGRSKGDQGKEDVAARTTPGGFVASEEALREMMTKLLNVTEKKLMSVLQQRLATPAPTVSSVQPEVRRGSCENYLKSGYYTSGIYTLHLNDARQPIKVFCDMDSAGGGWVVIQRRLDGSENFYRNWTDYERGFGNLTSEFWLGNDKIHRLTKSGGLSWLLVLMEDWEGNKAQAWYRFEVDSALTMYQLTVHPYYPGNAGDSLKYNHGGVFTTPDIDNDAAATVHCSQMHTSSWWHNDCTQTNLNGLYGTSDSSSNHSVFWFTWRGTRALKRVEMRIKEDPNRYG